MTQKDIFGGFSDEDIEALIQLIRSDLEKSVEDWNEQDCQDWRDMGYRLPKGAGKTRKVDRT